MLREPTLKRESVDQNVSFLFKLSFSVNFMGRKQTKYLYCLMNELYVSNTQSREYNENLNRKKKSHKFWACESAFRKKLSIVLILTNYPYKKNSRTEIEACCASDMLFYYYWKDETKDGGRGGDLELK